METAFQLTTVIEIRALVSDKKMVQKQVSVPTISVKQDSDAPESAGRAKVAHLAQIFNKEESEPAV